MTQTTYRLPRILSGVTGLVGLGALIAACGAAPEQTFSKGPVLLLALSGLFFWFAWHGDRPASRDRMLVAWLCGAAGGLMGALLSVPSGSWEFLVAGYLIGGPQGFVIGALVGAFVAQAIRTNPEKADAV